MGLSLFRVGYISFNETLITKERIMFNPYKLYRKNQEVQCAVDP
jgi:hypothetical protein